MSQPTVIDLARVAYAALNRGDLDGFLAVVHPDVEFRSLVAEAEGRHYRGHDGARQWWEAVLEALGGMQFEVEELHELDDEHGWTRLLVTGTVEGVEVTQRMYQAVALRDGKAAWWATFRTEAEARAALEERGEGAG